MRSFPEIDRAEWMPLSTARSKLVTGQVPALDAPAGILDAARARRRPGRTAPARAASTDSPDETAMAATKPSVKSAGDAYPPTPANTATVTAMPKTPPRTRW